MRCMPPTLATVAILLLTAALIEMAMSEPKFSLVRSGSADRLAV